MHVSWELVYIGVFVETIILSLILTPLAEKLGFKLGLIDAPVSAIKVHKGIKARSGGIAIFFAFIGAIILNIFSAKYLIGHTNLFPEEISKYLNNIPFLSKKLLAILSGGIFIFIIGLIDDKYTLGPWTKLVFQFLSPIPLLLADIRIVLFIPYPCIGYIMTVLWVVLLTNSFNFLDNMNGLTSGISAIVLLVLSAISYTAGEIFMTMTFLALAGSIIGFWRYNFFNGHPFMGDGGSLFIGYSIAAFTIIATYAGTMSTSLPVLMPVVVLGVPIFDTMTVLWMRWKRGAPLMKGDTNHFSHRLVALGLSRNKAVLFIYLVTLCVGLSAMLLRYLPFKGAIILGCQTIIIFSIIHILERVSYHNSDKGRDK